LINVTRMVISRYIQILFETAREGAR
jgi:hypothetical protein